MQNNQIILTVRFLITSSKPSKVKWKADHIIVHCSPSPLPTPKTSLPPSSANSVTKSPHKGEVGRTLSAPPHKVIGMVAYLLVGRW